MQLAGIALTWVGALHGGMIEGLPDRDWTSRHGTKISARLSYLPTGSGNTAEATVLLIPREETRTPQVVRIQDLSDDDQRYIDQIRTPHANSRQRFQREVLTYKDGQPVPGRFNSYDDRTRALTFRDQQKNTWFSVDLDSFSAESQVSIIRTFRISPRLETTLSEVFPLINSGTPKRLGLDRVPIIKQEGRYCVPASAAMIANYHGLPINQHQLAHMSSTRSRNHQGTYAGDMANAMESLGFMAETKRWAPPETKEDYTRFEDEVMTFVRAALNENGPLYVSFKPGVFGDSGHGCVIVEYTDASQGTIGLNNPWGRRDRMSYRDFSQNAREVIRFHKLAPATSDGKALETSVVAALHRMPADLTDAMNLLRSAGLKPVLRLHGRHDRRDDAFEMQRWALAQGQRIVSSSLVHHAVLLVPRCHEDRIVGWFLLRREGDNPNPMVRLRNVQAWQEATRAPLSAIYKSWASPVNTLYQSAWDIPLIELN